MTDIELADELRERANHYVNSPEKIDRYTGELLREAARALIAQTERVRVLEAALADDDFVRAPREPTRAMLKAAHDAKIFLNMTGAGWSMAYKAMIGAITNKVGALNHMGGRCPTDSYVGLCRDCPDTSGICLRSGLPCMWRVRKED